MSPTRNIFVISDTHFNHTNILRFKDDKQNYFRGDNFASVEEMNETMVDNWNKTVKDQDIVYHLGDVYMTNGAGAYEILSRLKGRKRLLLGNHDNGRDQTLHRHFQKISLWRDFKDFGLLLTHVPVHPGNLRGSRNVHGHIHQNASPDDRYVNVCVEWTNYTPVSLEDL